MDVLEIVRELILYLLVLLGALIAGWSWFEHRKVRKQVLWVGLVVGGGAAAQLLDYAGSAWRWPARAFLAMVLIVAIVQSLRSGSRALRWVAGTGVATIVGLFILLWLPRQVPGAIRVAIAVLVAGVAVAFVASMLRTALAVSKDRGRGAEDPAL